MPPASRYGTTSGTAALADHVSSGTYARTAGGVFGAAYLGLVVYNDSFVSNPIITATWGADAFTFIAGQQAPLGVVSVEMWLLHNPTTSSDVFTFSHPGGTSLSYILYIMELCFCGRQGEYNWANIGANGATGNPTASITTQAYLGGRKNSVGVPATNNLVVGMCVANVDGTATILGGGSGTLDLNTTAGTGAAKIAGAAAFTPATGGSDTISFTQSGVGTAWAEIVVECQGSAIDVPGTFRAGALLPSYF